ncbi:winged helix-turn-helix transcriptional regulator [Paraherbaspirillum soli]|uniref:Winged helix-turn-helix transcriptional regulator n=1 Tax=Paraherbaspirillum soli TaxID=631222 RepID=A0ABW0MA72_9BURK
MIGNKWAVPIVLTLHAKSPLRNSDLKHSVDGISPKELAKQLRLLEAAGVIGRKVYPSIPPRVEYWLTDLGSSLHPLLEGLAAWAALHGEQVERNRDEYAAGAEQEAASGSVVHRIW